jgi:hypothetical protein
MGDEIRDGMTLCQSEGPALSVTFGAVLGPTVALWVMIVGDMLGRWSAYDFALVYYIAEAAAWSIR